MDESKQKLGILGNKWCWTCTAKAGFAVGIASLVWGRDNPYIPLLAIIFSIAGLVMRKRELDLKQRDILVTVGIIGLILGIITISIFLYGG